MALVAFFWILLGVDLLLGFSDELRQVENLWKRIGAIVLIVLGTPFFFVSGFIIEILEGIMPEGWDDDGFF